MVAEGIDPQTVEQASSQAGYPAPVLQLLDEAARSRCRRRSARSRGPRWRRQATRTSPHPAEAVLDRLVEEFGRKGRAAGRGSTTTRTAVARGSGRACARSWVRRTTTSTCTSWPSACWSSRRSRPSVPRRGSAHQRGRRERRLGPGHRIPAVDGRGGAVRRGLPGGVAGFVARADALAERYGERFTVPDCAPVPCG